MQENEFEKKMRSLMDDLEISPSAPVWDYVEKRIPKSNRRRRFIAFFLLLTGFAVCGYFMYHKFSADNINDAHTIVGVTPETKNAGKNKERYAAKEHDKAIIIDTATETGDITHSTATTSKDKKIDKIVAAKITTPILTKADKIAQSNFKTADAITVQDESSRRNSAEDNNIINNPSTALEPAENSSTKDAGTTVDSSTTVTDNTLNDKTDSTTTALTTNEAAKKTTQPKKITVYSKKLQWGISAFYGRSDAVQNIGGITGAEKAYAWDGSLNSGGSSNYTDSLLYDGQSKIVKAKSAFGFGINLRKPLSSRLNITTGIEFMHMNMQIQTGQAKDSSATFYYNNSQMATRLENFYRPGTGSTQVNKYTSIQLPLFINYQLNQSKRLPLSVDAGLSVTRIISSNALLYDSYNFAYYENNELLSKTQLHTTIGFNAGFRVGNGSLVLGPRFQYGLTGLVKNNNESQHLFVWGLQARYFLKK